MRTTAASRLVVSAVVLALTAGGCSILVAGEVPDFQCNADTTGACPSGLRCDTAALRCVSADSSAPIDEAGGEDVLTDDVRDGGGDADAGPLDLGAKCRVDLECKSKLCGASTILTTVITATTGPICTSPCCTSAECPSSFVCFNGATGGGYCVPAALAQRTPAATGGKGGGVSCTANTECRSGLCTGTPKSCLDTCCVASDCSGATTCRLKSVASPPPSHEIWACALSEPGANKVPGDSCAASTECGTDTCIGFGASQICRPPCSNTASCRTVPGFTSGHCLYGSSGNDYFKFCFSGTTAGDSPAGAACADETTCQSDYCDAELKKCANVCGKDSDCAADEACRPCAVNTPYLRCVKKP
jgi:hypothetical protein